MLNSKSEFNRCQLGRLTLGEEKSSNSPVLKDIPSDTNPILTDKDAQEDRNGDKEEEECTKEIEEWERKKADDKRMKEIKDNIDLGRGLPMSPSRKRAKEDNLDGGSNKKGRKLKYPVISRDWGEQREGAEDGNKDDIKEQRRPRKARVDQEGFKKIQGS